MYKKGRYFLIFYSILICILLNGIDKICAQNLNMQFSHITVKEGLSSPNIYCFYKDKEGFLWLATENGLNKYNGYNFVAYKSVKENPYSISSNYMRSIVGSRDGNLWIGTSNGLNYYDRDKDLFNHYFFHKNDSITLTSSDIYSIAVDKEENLWLATDGGGLYFFNTLSKTYTSHRHISMDPGSISSNRIYFVYADRQGRLWIGTWEGMLDLFDNERKQFIHYTLSDKLKPKLNHGQIRGILEDQKGDLWISTFGSGIYRLTEDTNGKFSIRNFCHDPNDVNSLANDNTSRIIEDHGGGLWIGTENGGLDFLNTKDLKFKHFRAEGLEEASLSGNSIWSLFQDNFDNLWVGTYESGINLSKASKSTFSHFKNISCDEQSLSYNTVSSFFEDRSNNIWIGTDGGGLNLFNRKNGTFKRYNTKNSNLSSNAVLSVFEDSKSNLWIGTWQGGLNLFNRHTGYAKRFTSENSGLGCNNIISINEDKSGTLWVGTFWGDGGMSYFDTKQSKFVTYTKENSGLSNNSILTIVNGNDGKLFVGTVEGFNILDPVNRTFKKYFSETNNPTSLSHNTVYSILVARDSSIWLGTYDGLNKFDPKTGLFKRYFVKDGLPGSNISGIEEDAEGNLWLSTDNGISKLNPRTQIFRNYDVSDGLQGYRFYRCSHYKSRNGEIYFGGANGFNVFDPSKIRDVEIKPPVYLTGFKIFNKPVIIGAKGSPLQKNITETQQIELSYKYSAFTFEFAALYYSSPEKIRYAYKLEGFDNDWNYVGNERTATYTNLNPGKYTFRVKVPFNNGICNEEGTSVRVIIIPPFWMAWWFKVLMIFTLSLILLGIYAFRVRTINQRNKMLAKVVDNRTRELKQKNNLMKQQSLELNETNTLLEERQQQIEEQTEKLMFQKEELQQVNMELNELNATKDKFFSIIAHDIKNPFNSILGFSDLLLNNFTDWTDEKKLQIIRIIYDSSQSLFELLDNLLQWSRSQRGMIEFDPVTMELNQLINGAIYLLKDSAAAKKIEIKTDFLESGIYLSADIRMIDAIFRNILSNAIKFTYPGGAIQIRTGIHDNYAIAEISDNGMGMSDEIKAKLFRIDAQQTSVGTNDEKGSGLGLILVKEFITKHDGSIEVESTLGKGSTFNIKIPLNYHHEK
jgi:ligand-binding sensor domain-containing protein/signal transduction histidine kinase